jgi:hypothetical protein
VFFEATGVLEAVAAAFVVVSVIALLWHGGRDNPVPPATASAAEGTVAVGGRD